MCIKFLLRQSRHDPVGEVKSRPTVGELHVLYQLLAEHQPFNTLLIGQYLCVCAGVMCVIRITFRLGYENVD